MKNSNRLLLIIFIAISLNSRAQITQLEIASGASKTNFSMFSANPISKKGNFSITTLAFYEKYHKQEEIIFDETGVQTTLYWNMNAAFAIGQSFYFNSVSGFSERLSLRYSIRTKNFFFNSISTIAHAEKTGYINGELFLQMQYIKAISQDWKLLFNVQMLSHWDKFSIHTRSFQQLRIGTDYQYTQFGLAIDFDQYGEGPIFKNSLGVFIRKTIANN